MGYLYNGARLQPDYLMAFTPDAVTAVAVPGMAYQPFPNFDGSPRGNYDAGPAIDGFDARDPFGRLGIPFFDGLTTWNPPGVSTEVSRLLNNQSLLMNKTSQLLQWQLGQVQFPPNYNVPTDLPPFIGTPASPVGTGIERGFAGLPYGYGGMGMGMGMMPNSQIGSPMMQTPQGVTPAVPGPGVMPPPVR
jgi:hypothetical protein